MNQTSITPPTPLHSLRDHLYKKLGLRAELSCELGSIRLDGQAEDWRQKVAAGWAVVGKGYRGVINRLMVPGLEEERLMPASLQDGRLEGRVFDAVIIGGGVIGCAIARELSRYQLSIALLEKEYDVAVHTSSRNDGMIHDGFAAKPGTKKAWYNVRGNRLWDAICSDLDISFHRPGSLILFRTPASRLAYPLMAKRARANGVDGWEYWNRQRVRSEEPEVCDAQYGGFFLPSAGVLSPYKATLALAESAVSNGVEVVLDCCVLGFSREANSLTHVRTNRGSLRAGVVINAAGNWADVVAELAGDGYFSLHQRRGTELILDVTTGAFQRHILGRPSLLQAKAKTKGGGLVPTVEGNILVGPTAREEPGREHYATQASEMDELARHLTINKRLSLSQVITYFAGVRPCTYDEDFILEASQTTDNLVHVAGIQSPGLASAPALAQDAVRLALTILERDRLVRPRPAWQTRRHAQPRLYSIKPEDQNRLIHQDSAYGRIVCRCEAVSEGEIRDALRGPLAVDSLDAIKRRTRAGMGRCHGGFCTPLVMSIIATERQLPLLAIRRKGPGSELCVAETKAAGRPSEDGGER